MTTVAAIADEAFDAVAAEVTDAIQSVTATYTAVGVFNAVTGQSDLSETTATGRLVVDTVRPIGDIFPDYVAGPADELVLVEGLTSLPEGAKLTYAGKTKVVRRSQDILAAGTLFYAVAN